MEPCQSKACPPCPPSNAGRSDSPVIINLPGESRKNRNFRTVCWTGCHLQLTLMTIPPRGDIGQENHADTDQMLRVEWGQALVRIGQDKDAVCRRLGPGQAIFIPAGTCHNVCNVGNCPLRLSSLYAPPQHPRGAVEEEKKEESH